MTFQADIECMVLHANPFSISPRSNIQSQLALDVPPNTTKDFALAIAEMLPIEALTEQATLFFGPAVE